MKHSTYLKRLDKDWDFKKESRVEALNECQAKASTTDPGTCPLWTNCVPWDHTSMQVCLSYQQGQGTHLL